MPPLSVIDVKVIVTLPLTVLAKWRSPSLTEFPHKLPESDDKEVTYHPGINDDDDSDYDQEGSDAESNYIQLAP